MKCPGCKFTLDEPLFLEPRVEDKKVKLPVNARWLFHFHATHGLPLEVSVDILKLRLGI